MKLLSGDLWSLYLGCLMVGLMVGLMGSSNTEAFSNTAPGPERTTSDQVRTGQIASDQIGSGQIGSDQVGSGQIGSGQIGGCAKTPSGQLRDALNAIRQENNISALGLTIVHPDPESPCNQLITLGSQAHDDPTPISAQTVFRLGSITKGFTALTLMRLQARGKMNLDDPLKSHLPETLWTNPWQAESPITLAQLLEHSAGFMDLSKAEWDSAKPLDLDEALRRYAPQHHVLWAPGQFHSYSNLGAGLLGRAMEKTMHTPFEDLLRLEVLEPLGMKQSGFDPHLLKVTGYDRDGVTPIPYWHMVYRPFGALNASLEDMSRYVRAHLRVAPGNGAEFLSDSDWNRIELPGTTLAARHGLRAGYGLGNYRWVRDGVEFHGHGGDADGFLARMGYSHELQAGYFIVINAFNSRALGSMRRMVENTVIAQGLGHRATVETAANALSNVGSPHWLPGQYRALTGRFGLPGNEVSARVRIRNGRLEYQAPGRKGWAVLKAANTESARNSDTAPLALLLHRDGQRHPSLLALRQADGSVLLIDDDHNLKKISDGAP